MKSLHHSRGVVRCEPSQTCGAAQGEELVLGSGESPQQLCRGLVADGGDKLEVGARTRQA